jgi:hypothetical protein
VLVGEVEKALPRANETFGVFKISLRDVLDVVAMHDTVAEAVSPIYLGNYTHQAVHQYEKPSRHNRQPVETRLSLAQARNI